MSIKRFIEEKQFEHHFQPIYHLGEDNKSGYEALLRSKKYQNPFDAFLSAKKENLLYELDTTSIRKAIITYHRAGFDEEEKPLFINIFPSTILDEKFPLFLDQIKKENWLNNQQIVFEISETEMIEDYDIFKNLILYMKANGFQVAIDDIGKGYSNLQNMIELQPDFLKLDQYLSRDVHLSIKKQAIISFFIHYARQFDCNLIIEGIETEKELHIVNTLGVYLAQGYLLGRPSELKKLSKVN